MIAWRQQRGQSAENTVLNAARRRGLRCLERNYRSYRGELDLVLADADTLVVVEVRYRSRKDYGLAIETVTASKRRSIVNATRAFLASRPSYAERPLRFDVVGVDADGGLDWIENAFEAEQ